jgi:hypothetical protein
LSDKDEGKSATPAPSASRVRYSLNSLGGLLQEAADIYRRMKANKLPHEQGRSLVWVLAQMRAMLEAQHLKRIEAKLSQLAEAAQARGLIDYGGGRSARAIRTGSRTEAS